MKAYDTDPNAGESWFNAANYNKHAFQVKRQELNNLVHARISRNSSVFCGACGWVVRSFFKSQWDHSLDTFEKYMLFAHHLKSGIVEKSL